VVSAGCLSGAHANRAWAGGPEMEAADKGTECPHFVRNERVLLCHLILRNGTARVLVTQGHQLLKGGLCTLMCYRRACHCALGAEW
jgi:hypothetical protein